MQLAVTSDEAGLQIYRHLGNWRIITLFVVDHTLIHVYPVRRPTTYLYKTNLNVVFLFYLGLRIGLLFSVVRSNFLVHFFLYRIIILPSYQSVTIQMSATNGGPDHYAIRSRPQ